MKAKFLTVGTGLVLILTLLNIAGWVESLEARDKYRHCLFQGIDEVYTDQQAHNLNVACSNKSGYQIKVQP